MSDRWRGVASSPLVHCLILALPFLAGIIVLKGLTVTLSVHQGGDEAAHYAAVLAYARQLPFVDLHRSYGTSSGPLMYYAYGVFVRIFGLGIYKLRLLNTLVSYLTTLVVYFMLRRSLSTPPAVSLALAAVVGFSPYLLGQTFVVLTDNFMYLWLALALNALVRFARKPVFLWLVVAAACTALALLTRQFAIWLVPTAALAVWRCSSTPARRWVGLAVVAASCVPLGLVMLAWGGVVQPGSGGFAATSTSRYYSLSQAVAVVGFCAMMLVPLTRLKEIGQAAIRRPIIVGVVLAAAVGLALDPIPQLPLQFGYIGFIAAFYPAFLQTSIVYWILTPLGAAFLVWAVFAFRDDPPKQLGAFALAAATLTSLASAVYFQRYVDVPILLALVVLISGSERVRRLDFLRWWLLVGAFIGWVVWYAA